jgi:hypothetical protein
MKQKIVIFANSVKHGNHCVAGKSIETKKWYRPVPSSDGGALKDSQIRYFNNYGPQRSVKHLQIIIMDFTQNVPLYFQPENYEITDIPWQQEYKIDLKDISDYLDHPATLWGEGDSVESQLILNHKVPVEQSLYLIKTNQIKLERPVYGGKPHNKVSFVYNGIDYTLSCTDKNFDSLFNENEVQNNKYLCISLGEKFNNKHYKLVAGLI